MNSQLEVCFDNNTIKIINDKKEFIFEKDQIDQITIIDEKVNWFSTIWLNLVGFILFNNIEKAYKFDKKLAIKTKTKKETFLFSLRYLKEIEIKEIEERIQLFN